MDKIVRIKRKNQSSFFILLYPVNPVSFFFASNSTITQTLVTLFLMAHGETAYSLRYNFATLQMMAGERDKVISDSMGHTQVNFTKDVYQKALPVMQETASDKLASLLFSGPRTMFAQETSEQVM